MSLTTEDKAPDDEFFKIQSEARFMKVTVY